VSADEGSGLQWAGDDTNAPDAHKADGEEDGAGDEDPPPPPLLADVAFPFQPSPLFAAAPSRAQVSLRGRTLQVIDNARVQRASLRAASGAGNNFDATEWAVAVAGLAAECSVARAAVELSSENFKPTAQCFG